MTGTPDVVAPLTPLTIDGLVRPHYRVFPIPDHLADKLCATIGIYVRDGQPANSSRVKDLVDIAIIASTQTISADRLRTAIVINAAIRKVELPERFVVPDHGWARRYPKVAAENSDNHFPPPQGEMTETGLRLLLGLGRSADSQIWAFAGADKGRFEGVREASGRHRRPPAATPSRRRHGPRHCRGLSALISRVSERDATPFRSATGPHGSHRTPLWSLRVHTCIHIGHFTRSSVTGHHRLPSGRIRYPELKGFGVTYLRESDEWDATLEPTVHS
jgi:hypothetical protein